MADQAEHELENRRHWDAMADEWVGAGERAWAAATPAWGIWQIPDAAHSLLPADMSRIDAIELGCGTGYCSAWMARRGATVTGIDNSQRQLATARRLSAEHELDITWIHGSAEAVPRPAKSFDFAFSEYGAAIWCDPEVWIPEAHRLLRAGGRLVFLGNHPLSLVCTPLDGSPTDVRLHRSYFDLGRLDWRNVEIEPGGIEFNRPISAWFDLFRRVGFDVENYLELGAPADAEGVSSSQSAEWAKDYPSEQVWFLRKR